MRPSLKFLSALFLPLSLLGQELPQYVDNSTLKYFPPIIDQSGGSCAQASAIGYVFTYEVNRLLDRDASIDANRFSYQYVWNLVNDGEDQGGFADDGLFVAMRSGAVSVEDMGFCGTYSFMWPSGYEKYRNAFRYRVAEIIKFNADVDAIKEYLAPKDGEPGGIVSFSGHCRGWVIDNNYDGPSGTGYKSLLTGLPTSGSHAMTIVGYDDLVSYTDASGTIHNGAFIAVNSWGTYSHDQGRYYYPYDFFRDPASYTSHALGENVIGARVKYQEPKILFKLTLDYSSRNDLAYNTGATVKESAGIPDQYYLQTAMSNAGGDHSMRGAFDKREIEFALDFTDYISSANPNYCRYFLNITRSARGKIKGEGSLKALSVIDYRSGTPVEYKYKGTLPKALNDGYNVFVIGLIPRYVVDCSPVRRTQKPVYLKTKDGAEALISIEKNGLNAKIKYSLTK